MTAYEAYCTESSVLKELLYILTREDVHNVTRSDFPPYGYHVDYDCEPDVQKRIETYVDNNTLTYSKVNWL